MMDNLTALVVSVLLAGFAGYLVWTRGFATMDPMPFWTGVFAVVVSYAAYRTYPK